MPVSSRRGQFLSGRLRHGRLYDLGPETRTLRFVDSETTVEVVVPALEAARRDNERLTRMAAAGSLQNLGRISESSLRSWIADAGAFAPIHQKDFAFLKRKGSTSANFVPVLTELLKDRSSTSASRPPWR